MKRFHVHMAVENLENSIRFYFPIWFRANRIEVRLC